jgi:dipeptidyl aminopeptidase/acylaminoacyl peptidase
MTILRCAALAASFLFVRAAGAQALSPEDFAKHPEISEAAISPTGEYLAVAALTPDGKETHLKIIPMDGSKASDIRLGKNQHIIDIVWTDDKRVVVSNAEKDIGEERPHSTGELYGVDIDGKNPELLFGYVPESNGMRGKRKDQGFASVARVLDEPGQVLVSYFSYTQGADPQTVIFKVDTHTGERKEIERVKRAAGMDFDSSGRLRVLVTLDEEDTPQVFYRQTAASELQPMPKNLVGYRTYGGWFTTNGEVAFLWISDKGEPSQLYKVDFAKGTREKVAGRADQDVGMAQIAGRHGTPFAVVYDAGRPSVEYVDQNSEFAALHSSLIKRFPGQLVVFSNFTRDEQKVLFHVYSDRNPGAYYQFDRKTNKILLLVESEPWIKSAQLAPMQPVEFKAKDGTTLYGFYTANGTGPEADGGDAARRPLRSVRQLGLRLARAVPGQPRLRGAAGQLPRLGRPRFQLRAERLEAVGRPDPGRHRRRRALGHRPGQGRSRPRVHFGASFGGYSALMNPVRNPGMYKCAVGYAGVYDLNLLSKTDWSAKSRNGRRWFDREIGADPAKRAEQSPANFAAKLDIPVFLIHGKDDQTAKVDQFHAMEDALQAAGKKPLTLLIEGEGHGFYNPANVADLYKRIDAFLKESIGPGAATSGGSN